MITSLRCKDTESLYGGVCPRRFRAIREQAERKLTILDAAATTEFLKSPPGNELEKLGGDRRGQWSIRINQQWRICFRYSNGNVSDVEIVDYH
ncbi:MAG: type II toxin-antitoxin system RelE/ParE family toxin [Candidatus Azotimanducaceae bacterium WSBS_2022_MAG_OTU7]